ncbi:MAG: hypothetical protein ACI9CD_000766 [Candidatus Deianiraeaceae bacterium]|jgi:hypothetical protein
MTNSKLIEGLEPSIRRAVESLPLEKQNIFEDKYYALYKNPLIAFVLSLFGLQYLYLHKFAQFTLYIASFVIIASIINEKTNLDKFFIKRSQTDLLLDKYRDIDEAKAQSLGVQQLKSYQMQYDEGKFKGGEEVYNALKKLDDESILSDRFDIFKTICSIGVASKIIMAIIGTIWWIYNIVMTFSKTHKMNNDNAKIILSDIKLLTNVI